jgi:hypothetical protein
LTIGSDEKWIYEVFIGCLLVILSCEVMIAFPFQRDSETGAARNR